MPVLKESNDDLEQSMMFSFRRLLSILALVLVGVTLGCGEPTDNPEDCTAAEFFDEGTEQCIACPAVQQPSCRAGCGFHIVEDSRGCPKAECNVQCDACPEGQFFSDEILACQSCSTAADPPDVCDVDPSSDAGDVGADAGDTGSVAGDVGDTGADAGG